MTSEADRDALQPSVSGSGLDTRIVETLADATDRKPMEIPPLYDSVDLDALTALVEGRDAEVHVQFEHVGRTVTVEAGTVIVEPE